MFGPDLYVTHDGSRHWRRLRGFDSVEGLEAADGNVIVLGSAGSCETGGSCRLTAWRAPVGSDRFTATVLGDNHGFTAFVRQGPDAYVLFAGLGGRRTYRLLVSSDSGAHWRRHPASCPRGQEADGNLSAAPGGVVWLECGTATYGRNYPDYLLVSTDQGHSWGPERIIPHGADPRESTLDIVATSAATGYAVVSDTQVLVTADAGRHWSPSLTIAHRRASIFDIGAQGLTHAHLLAVFGSVYTTDDAGRTWTSKTFHSRPHPVRPQRTRGQGRLAPLR